MLYGQQFPSSLRLDLYVFGITGHWRMGSANSNLTFAFFCPPLILVGVAVIISASKCHRYTQSCQDWLTLLLKQFLPVNRFYISRSEDFLNRLLRDLWLSLTLEIHQIRSFTASSGWHIELSLHCNQHIFYRKVAARDICFEHT